MVHTLPTTLSVLERLYRMNVVFDIHLPCLVSLLESIALTHGASPQDVRHAWALFKRSAGVPPSHVHYEQLDKYRLARARYYQLEALMIRLQPLLHRRQHILPSSHLYLH